MTRPLFLLLFLLVAAPLFYYTRISRDFSRAGGSTRDATRGISRDNSGHGVGNEPLTVDEEEEYDGLVALFRNATAYFSTDEEELKDLKVERSSGLRALESALCENTDFADGKTADDEFGPWTGFLHREKEARTKLWEAALVDRPEAPNLDIVRFVDGEFWVRNRAEKRGFWKNCRRNYAAILDVLASLAKKHGLFLPEIRIPIDCTDGTSHNGIHLPHFAPSKQPGVHSILLPNFQHVMWLMLPPPGAGRAPGSRTKWDTKEAKAIWRGTLGGNHLGLKDVLPLHHPRLSLLLHSTLHPNELDAKCTPRHATFVFGYPEWRESITAKYCVKEKIPWEDQVDRFKYMVSVDGYGAAFRVWRIFASGVVPMLPSNNVYLEHYYGLLRPWVDYVPAPTWSLAESIQWLRENDHAAHRIALNALRFSKRNHSLKATLCYLLQLWTRLAELQEGLDWGKIERTFASRLDGVAAVNGTDQGKVPFVKVSELKKLGLD